MGGRCYKWIRCPRVTIFEKKAHRVVCAWDPRNHLGTQLSHTIPVNSMASIHLSARHLALECISLGHTLYTASNLQLFGLVWSNQCRSEQQQICYLPCLASWSVIVQQQIPHTSTYNLNVSEPTEIRAGVISISISYKPLLASGLNFEVTEREERSLAAFLDKKKILRFSSLNWRQRTNSQKI